MKIFTFSKSLYTIFTVMFQNPLYKIVIIAGKMLTSWLPSSWSKTTQSDKDDVKWPKTTQNQRKNSPKRKV